MSGKADKTKGEALSVQSCALEDAKGEVRLGGRKFAQRENMSKQKTASRLVETKVLRTRDGRS